MGHGKQIEINLGKACDNRCVFCANGGVSPSERGFLPFDKVLSELRQAADEGYDALGFLGGEPTMYPPIEELVQEGSTLGFSRITLCTNGRRLRDEQLLRKLVSAGVSRITLSIHDHRSFIEDRLNGRAGAFKDKIKAINNIVELMKSGRFLQDGFALNACIHGGNVTCLPEFAAFFKNRGVNEIRFNYIRPEHRALADRKLVPPLLWVRKGLWELSFWNESRGGMIITISDVPFCGYPEVFYTEKDLLQRYMGELRDLDTSVKMSCSGGENREEFCWKERRKNRLKSQPEPCKECELAELCEGLWRAYPDIHGNGDISKARDDLPVTAGAVVNEVMISCDETEDEADKNKAENAPDHLIRVTPECNQSCLFCNNNASAPGYVEDAPAAVHLIQRLKAHGVGRIWFTGGEPTMVSWLPEFIEHASGAGVSCGIQTNAVLFHRRELASTLKQAGLHEALVSLHSQDAAVSDRLTSAPGTFVKTIQGIRNLIEEGIDVQINTVVCKENAESLPEIGRFICEEFEGRIHEWVVSFMAPVAAGERNAHMMVRYSHAIPYLERALQVVCGKRLLVIVPGVCGAPVCVLGGAAINSVEARGEPIPEGMSQRGYVEACDLCANRLWCSGIWKEYVKRFGLSEFKPLKERVFVNPADLVGKVFG